METSSVGRVSIVRRLVAVGAFTVLAVGVTAGSAPASAQAAPTLTGISPLEGPEGGGTSVTLTGTDLTPDASITVIRFGANDAVSQDCSSSTTCVAESPPGVGTVNVVVETSFGTSNALKYTYLAPLELNSANPTSGPPAGGARVTFTGNGFSTLPGGTEFDAAGLVFFTDVTCESQTTCTALSPPCAAGGEYFPFQVTVGGVLAQLDGNGPSFGCGTTGGAPVPTSKDQCKNGGWRNFPQFKNQGDCVSSVATGGKNPPSGP